MKTRAAKGTKRPQATTGAAPAGGLCLATVARWDDQGVLVKLPHAREPVAARVMLAPGETSGRARVDVGQGVVVMLSPGDDPVILGQLQPIGAPVVKAEARADGRRLELAAEDEIVLTCGESSLVMRRNGRVLLRGVQVETRAKGLNRVKGGTVAIN